MRALNPSHQGPHLPASPEGKEVQTASGSKHDAGNYVQFRPRDGQNEAEI